MQKNNCRARVSCVWRTLGLLGLLAGAMVAGAAASTQRAPKPNVLIIYADDIGRGDLSCWGQKEFSTPNIDRLAEQGMRFEHFYGCTVCAPARAGLLTGNTNA
ncbi:sulfatase-like hydrolase/transferase, partial [Pontiellaceae bacterium B12227]|nr:sulfatase-like hydrolase/transferase [Pontiellaceae bacterium B12227]